MFEKLFENKLLQISKAQKLPLRGKEETWRAKNDHSLSLTRESWSSVLMVAELGLSSSSGCSHFRTEETFWSRGQMSSRTINDVQVLTGIKLTLMNENIHRHPGQIRQEYF